MLIVLNKKYKNNKNNRKYPQKKNPHSRTRTGVLRTTCVVLFNIVLPSL